jgi:FkbM family methyltransferase
LDAGANEGQTANAFGSWFPKAEIYSFEPIKNTYELLLSNTRANPRIHCHQSALGERDGAAVMQVNVSSLWNRVVDADTLPTHHPSERVEMLRIDTFCKTCRIEHIDLLKTDCEGYDLQVLHGAESLLSANRIECIYCEVNFLRHHGHADFF